MTSLSKLYLRIVLLFILLTSSGCATDAPSPIVGGERSRFFDAASPGELEALDKPEGPVPLAVLHTPFEVDYALHESDGVYLGAWLRPDVSFSAFEDLVGKKHAVYVHDMFLGDEFPYTWLLRCIAAQAHPLIILRQPIRPLASQLYAADFPLAELADFAWRLGSYNLPMFVAFYPLESGHNMSASDYVLLFRYARAIFRAHAPMVAFVWTPPGWPVIDGEIPTYSSVFFPGADVVDWVGLPLFATRDAYGFAVCVLEILTPFYLAFQRHKPIMILPLGISHFSRLDYVYHIQEGADEILRIYRDILAGFPRVRLIVYMDTRDVLTLQDDFTITQESALMDAYQKAVSDMRFISNLGEGVRDGKLWLRSAFNGYYLDGSVLLDIKMLETELGIPAPLQQTYVEGRSFVSIDDMVGKRITVDYVGHVVYFVR